jgi:hypothetical protein
MPVTTGLETEGWLEVVGSDLRAGAAVVTMGQQLIEEGTPVSVVEEATE